MTLFTNNFQKITFSDFIVMYDLGPTQDQRGIGRVARSLLSALKRREVPELRSPLNKIPTIHFFPSIHWCPEILPSHSIVMVHDTTPLSLWQFFPDSLGEWLNEFFQIASQASRIVTISQSARDEVANHLLIELDRISVINNGITDLTAGFKSEDVAIPDIPYVTYVGASDPHKNIDIVLSALARNTKRDIGIAVIGSACDDVTDRASIWDLDPSLVFPMGKLGDDALASILRQSIALVMPSLYEGFGLPPFEAALAGTPSICSNRPAHNELLAGAALFVNPFLADAWLEAIRTLQNDRIQAEALATKASTIARTLTWENAAEQLFTVFIENVKDI